ncbi:MAG: hypothetical protein LBE98_00470 [Puniceicoccales bacterium]|nr:hypothetical protein [Puniceicoccales bacterium]
MGKAGGAVGEGRNDPSEHTEGQAAGDVDPGRCIDLLEGSDLPVCQRHAGIEGL